MTYYETYRPDETADEQLGELRERLSQEPYTGYPSPAERLVVQPESLVRSTDGRLVLLGSTCDISAADEGAPSLAEQRDFLDRGYKLDACGRPLHPWFAKMIADPLLGVVLGKGIYRHWGDNHTADAAVVKDGHVLLVKRRDTGEWAFPGGFVDTGEKVVAAAKRETVEETGYTIPHSAAMVPLYQGPIADPRMTAHAWPETSALLFRLEDDGPLPAVQGGDDAEAAAWLRLDELQESRVVLFGAHRFLLKQVLERLHTIEADKPQPLDLSDPVWTELLAAAPVYANVYDKSGTVRIRPAIPGEHVVTILSNGTAETFNTAGDQQVVVTNPGGEQYIIDAAKADKRYQPTNTPGIFSARGMVRAMANPTGCPVTITAPWGKQQYGGPDCIIAALFDPASPDVVDPDRYLIGIVEFETYAKREGA